MIGYTATGYRHVKSLDFCVHQRSGVGTVTLQVSPTSYLTENRNTDLYKVDEHWQKLWTICYKYVWKYSTLDQFTAPLKKMQFI